MISDCTFGNEKRCSNLAVGCALAPFGQTFFINAFTFTPNAVGLHEMNRHILVVDWGARAGQRIYQPGCIPPTRGAGTLRLALAERLH